MYYFLIHTLSLITFASAAVIQRENEAVTLLNEYNNLGNGNYSFRYVTSNGITRSEYAELVDAGKDKKIITIQGSYSYIDPNGAKWTVKYTAGENGYQAHVSVNRNQIPGTRQSLEQQGDDFDSLLDTRILAGTSASVFASLIGK